MNKKLTFGIVIVCLLSGIFLIPYITNPLVAKNKINFYGYLHILLSSLTRNGEKMSFLAAYAYNASENDLKLEEYAIDLYEKASSFGNFESDSILALYNIFVKNDEKKGLEYIKELSRKHEGVGNFYLGIYYVLKKNDYEKGVILMKPAKDNKFYYALKYPLSLDQPIENEKLRKEVENIKNAILEKREMSNVVFQL